jgi:hypothetical protein
MLLFFPKTLEIVECDGSDAYIERKKTKFLGQSQLKFKHSAVEFDGPNLKFNRSRN